MLYPYVPEIKKKILWPTQKMIRKCELKANKIAKYLFKTYVDKHCKVKTYFI